MLPEGQQWRYCFFYSHCVSKNITLFYFCDIFVRFHPILLIFGRNIPQEIAGYLSRRDGRLSWSWCWLYTKMVYLSADSHPSK